MHMATTDARVKQMMLWVSESSKKPTLASWKTIPATQKSILKATISRNVVALLRQATHTFSTARKRASIRTSLSSIRSKTFSCPSFNCNPMTLPPAPKRPRGKVDGLDGYAKAKLQQRSRPKQRARIRLSTPFPFPEAFLILRRSQTTVLTIRASSPLLNHSSN